MEIGKAMYEYSDTMFNVDFWSMMKNPAIHTSSKTTMDSERNTPLLTIAKPIHIHININWPIRE